MFRDLWLALFAPGRRWCTAIAAFGCAIAVWAPAGAALPGLCGSLIRTPPSDWGQLVGGPGVSPVDLGLGWIVMLLAMMPPLLADPIRHVWFASMPRRRAWAVGLCLAAYALVWTLVAPALMVLAWGLRGGLSETTALSVALCFAMVWSASPVAQWARNRCHGVRRVGANGRSADLECVAYGTYVGGACVAVCWPWMLLPILAEELHAPVMVLVTAWLVLDRLFPPRRAAWQLPPAVGQILWRLGR